jgi:hypothetical protein
MGEYVLLNFTLLCALKKQRELPVQITNIIPCSFCTNQDYNKLTK